ncbi:MAG: DUF1634 domain-containing protein [Sphingobacteriales bacterium]|nr:MAG: DUF1634 domain-containing protein [Sphingobacteriales bacterium]
MTNKKDMQLIIGRLLQTGVFASIGIVFVGGVIYLTRHGHELANYEVFKGVPGYIHPKYVFKSIFAMRGRAIIQLGIMLLIATPVIRVIFSAIGFVYEKDYLYIGITLLVLAIIIFSMVHGGVS